MKHMIPPFVLLVVWFPIVFWTGPHGLEETAIREDLQTAFADLNEPNRESWSSHFSSGVKTITSIYPLRFDERGASQYARDMDRQMEHPEVDIYQSKVRISGIFAEVDLYYRRPATNEIVDRMGQGRVQLIREGSAWRITNVEMYR